MNRERTDLDIPEGTVWPSTEAEAAPASGGAPSPAETIDDPADAIELEPGESPPASLDPDRDTAERNAAAGGWDGATEQIENDYEAEQLRRAAGGEADEKAT